MGGRPCTGPLVRGEWSVVSRGRFRSEMLYLLQSPAAAYRIVALFCSVVGVNNLGGEEAANYFYC